MPRCLIGQGKKASPMHYKTIIHEMILARPELHDRLQATRKLKTTVNGYAMALKRKHRAWIDQLEKTPGYCEARIRSQAAMELALEDILRELSANELAEETLSLTE